MFGVSGVTAEDAVANDSGVANHWNQSEDWGTVQAAKSSVTFSISKKPASGFVALPRLNNRWKSIAAEGYTGELRFVPEIDHWRIFVPDDLEYPATINMQLIETVRLCEKPFVVEQSKDGSVSLPAHHPKQAAKSFAMNLSRTRTPLVTGPFPVIR
ncbi:hypothetical protein C2E31_14785 [Rhodopirellula baltica]|nr:hypothetical protein C2E31_14680 [Rhodopirellula baltica]PNY36113.1 hypothetical protein C2E31_14785 [Rhodopirellula baltica]